jgi:hypothetical protein
MSIKTNNLGGRLFLLFLTSCFLWTGQVYSQSDEQTGMLLAPMGQYQFWQMGSINIHSPGGGILIQQKAGDGIFISIIGMIPLRF